MRQRIGLIFNSLVSNEEVAGLFDCPVSLFFNVLMSYLFEFYVVTSKQ
jgi:hypothetical protein